MDPDDGTAQYNDGKVGVAYIPEFPLAKYCERLQKQLIRQLDREFKRYPVHRGIDIENSTFSLEFTPPNNFSSYRELDLDNQRATLFSSLEAVSILQQFKLKKYLGLTEEEMKANEEYWKQENKYNKGQNATRRKHRFEKCGNTNTTKFRL